MPASRTATSLVLVLAIASGAAATTFVATSDRVLARGADVIVAGTVRALDTVATADGAIATRATVDVDTQYKGRPLRRVLVEEPGGTSGDRTLWIEGSPEFRVGERQLLFLADMGDGTMRTLALGMGQYRLDGPAGGAVRAERRLAAPVLGGARQRRQRFARLERTIRRAVATDRHTDAPPARRRRAAHAPMVADTQVSAFTFMDRPTGRWHQADLGEPVVIGVDETGDRALGAEASLAAVDSAMAAWTDVAGATIVLERGGAAEPMPMLCDGVSQIIFNDVFGEIPNPSDCSGVLAIGGYCTAGRTEIDVIDGVQYRRIIEGNITFSNGFGSCPFWTPENLAEITTHELGHVIGIGHSSEVDDEPSAVLKDATMYYRAHFDGRGASVHADDVAAVRALYAGGDEPPDDDVDRDGVPDDVDNCPGSDPARGIANAAQTDLDGDGVGDLCDPCPLDPADACHPILANHIKARARGQGLLEWKGQVDWPLAGDDDGGARIVLIAGDGVLLDSAASAGPGNGRGKAKGLAKHPRKRRFRGADTVLSLGRTRADGFRMRLKVRPFATPAVTATLLSVNLQVGAETYTAPLICRPRGNLTLSCTN